MEYQILDKELNLVAWIDTNKEDQIIAKDYIIQSGDKLRARETTDGIKGVIEGVVKL